MTSQLSILAIALIIASPIFAAGGPSSGGSPSSSSSSAGGSGGAHSAGGGGGAGGHSGGGGGGHFGGGLGGHGAASSARGAMENHGAQHLGSMHAGRAVDGKHVESRRMAMGSSSNVTGMRHHHHYPMREPGNDDFLQPMRYSTCIQHVAPDRPWSDCFGTTKSPAHGVNSRF